MFFRRADFLAVGGCDRLDCRHSEQHHGSRLLVTPRQRQARSGWGHCS
jgi:hypothetical protein